MRLGGAFPNNPQAHFPTTAAVIGPARRRASGDARAWDERVGSPTRGRNATTLARRHVYDFDARVAFEEDGHAYFIDGERFTGPSVTKIKEVAFGGDVFDGPLIIEKNLASWRRRPTSKYGKLVVGLNDEAAREAILRTWDDANRLGTLLHTHAELQMNEEALEISSEVAREYAQFLVFRKDFPSLRPVRTELSLFYTRPDGTVCAVGQLDALFADESGRMCIVDFKRTDKPLYARTNAYGKTGIGVLDGTPANDHYKYSFQQACYSVMFEQRTGVPVNFLFLLALHPEKDKYELVQCTDLRAEARAILDAL